MFIDGETDRERKNSQNHFHTSSQLNVSCDCHEDPVMSYPNKPQRNVSPSIFHVIFGLRFLQPLVKITT